MCDLRAIGRGSPYRPADTPLDLLSITHVYKATAGWSANRVLGAEVRVVDMTRDEVSDDRWHSVYQGRIISGVSELGKE